MSDNDLKQMLTKLVNDNHKRIYVLDVNENMLKKLVNLVNEKGYTINKNLFIENEYIIELS